ncbi:MAG: hypothetical protein IJB13_03970, partial [Clostridia bacterium]|nr:hypothetical protein [Clostridia bacterium]
IPASRSSSDFSRVITSPAVAKTTPSSLIMSSARVCPTIRAAKFKRLLNLYLPTLAKSYLLASKKVLRRLILTASSLGTSPGRRRL